MLVVESVMLLGMVLAQVLVPDTQIGERCEQQVLSLTGVGTCVGAIVIGVGAGVGDNVGHTPPYNTHH